jgi:type II secretory pathway component HofQ
VLEVREQYPTGYTGKATANLQNIGTGRCFWVIADFTNFNIVTDTVTGAVTLRLKDADQALDIILRQEPGMRKSGNVATL